MCNISSDIKNLNVHPPGLHHGFICGQIQQPEPFLEINQTKPGPLLTANQTLWNTDAGFRQFFSAYLTTLFIHFDSIVKILLLCLLFSSERVNSIRKVHIAYFSKAEVRNYWKYNIKFYSYKISKLKLFRYTELQFTDCYIKN